MKIIIGLLILATFAFADDHGNIWKAATNVELNSITPGSIEVAGDVDFFRIDVPDSGTLVVYTTGSTDTFAYLFKSNGRQLQYNDDSGENRNFKIKIRGLTPGIYYIKVRHYNSWLGGRYLLHVEFVPETPPASTDGYGHSISTAITISTNSTTPGSIESAGDEDYFKITVPVSGILTIYTTGNTDTFGYLLKSDGTQLQQNDDSDESNRNFRISQRLTAGTYYIKVKHYDASKTGDYILNVNLAPYTPIPASDHGNSISTATTVGLNSTTPGRIGGGNYVDFFKITVPNTGTVTIYTTGDLDTVGDLYRANDTVIVSDDESGTDHNFRISRRLTAGIYYVGVYWYHYNYSNGSSLNYMFHVEFAPETPASTDGHGHSISTATNIHIDSATHGSIESAGDAEYFKVNVPALGTLNIYSTGSIDTYGYLINEAGTVIASNDDAYRSSKNFRISRFLVAGTYYIKVRDYSDTRTGNYTLHVNFAPYTLAPADDHGNSMSTATTVGLNSTTSGRIESTTDIDYFKVILPTAGELLVRTTGNVDTYGYVYNSRGTMIVSNDDDGSGHNFRISRHLTSGTYYIKVRHRDSTRIGNYSLVVHFSSSDTPSQTDDYGNSISTATIVELPGTIQGNIGEGRDEDYFEITVPVSGNLNIYTTGNVDTYGYLYNSRGTVIASNDDNGSDSNFQITYSLPAGTYYIKVRGYDDHTSIGDYVLHINLAPHTLAPADDHGNSKDTATIVELNSITQGNIGRGGDVDYFKVTLLTEGRLLVYTTGSVDTFGYLYSPRDTVIVSNDDDGSGHNFKITTYSLPAGTYYIKVKGYDSHSIGDYELHVNLQ